MVIVRNGHHYFSANWGHQWASHAITCLLLDILEGERGDIPETPSTLGASPNDDASSSEKHKPEDSVELRLKKIETILTDDDSVSLSFKAEDAFDHHIKNMETMFATDATPGIVNSEIILTETKHP